MSHRDTVVHLIAGGAGGTAGAIVTCPLEVVKTRLQSSVANFHQLPQTFQAHNLPHHHHVYVPTLSTNVQSHPRLQISTCTAAYRAPELLTLSTAESNCNVNRHTSIGIWKCLRCIIENEGAKALFKGLGPNLVGVMPSRAIYFCTYSNAKSFLNQHFTPESSFIHMCSAVCAGFSACTATNPIWFVKTRLQLDQRKNGGLSAFQCVRDIYRSKGLIGFYKGITASYFGISETVIHFVIYEAIKAKLRDCRNADHSDGPHGRDYAEFMLAGATSKTCASFLAYPHEVARTRLRQEGDKYRSFWQTIILVFREEGYRGLYRGLGTQLVRQIPNTAIMMATYEAVVYLLGSSSTCLTTGSSSISNDDGEGECCFADDDPHCHGD